MRSNEYVFSTNTPFLTSSLMTPTNSANASPSAPDSASVTSCVRRASDSMIRSSTASCAIFAAAVCVIDGSNDVTLPGTETFGIGGSTHTRADAPNGEGLAPGPGRASAALVAIQCASAGPDPTVSDSVGSVPSDSSAAGCGLCVAASEAMGSAATRTSVASATAGARQPIPRSPVQNPAPASRGATSRINANRPAQAMTRLARMAVLVQNSSTVGPMSSADSSATPTPNTKRPTGPSGTVRGSGIMNRAKIITAGDVTRICHSCSEQSGVACDDATMQWSGTG